MQLLGIRKCDERLHAAQQTQTHTYRCCRFEKLVVTCTSSEIAGVSSNITSQKNISNQKNYRTAAGDENAPGTIAKIAGKINPLK